LAERLAARGPTLLFTTGTITAAGIAGRRLADRAIHQFVPIDTPASVERFLDHWRPDLVIFAESELWPTMLAAVHRRSLPLAVVNARMSERSFRAWQAFTPLARAVLGRAGLYLAQSQGDAERLRSLGAERVLVIGNLKFDAPPPPADESAVATFRQQIGGRPTFVAASTHPGEEAAVLDAHREMTRDGTRLLTILAPRHPERGDAIASQIANAGLSVARRSRSDPISEDVDVYVADSIGEMGTWYRLADLAFLGGSMVMRGGQNPIEAAKLMVPIIHGAHVDNFRDIYASLDAANAAARIDGDVTLAATLRRLIHDRGERERLVRDARACIERFTGALDRTLDALEPNVALICRNEASNSP
jgi:3-deoxy-D-manno-octulosonic-acid transferase